jgi:hypothetical protein
MTVVKHFVFLEFTNPEVNKILSSLREALSGKRYNSPAHITVRGPYKELPNTEMLKEKAAKIANDYVFIADPGVFKTQEGYAVYLTAVSKVFDARLWYKPDFKNERKMPHITLFESSKKNDAYDVRDFLRNQHIEITTGQLALSIYTSKQHQLLQEENTARVCIDGSPTIEKIRAPHDLIERAQDFRWQLLNAVERPSMQLALV